MVTMTGSPTGAIRGSVCNYLKAAGRRWGCTTTGLSAQQDSLTKRHFCTPCCTPLGVHARTPSAQIQTHSASRKMVTGTNSMRLPGSRVASYSRSNPMYSSRSKFQS